MNELINSGEKEQFQASPQGSLFSNLDYMKEDEYPGIVFGESEFRDYRLLNEIGDGTYGVVYKAEHLESKRVVALKKIKLDVRILLLRYE